MPLCPAAEIGMEGAVLVPAAAIAEEVTGRAGGGVGGWRPWQLGEHLRAAPLGEGEQPEAGATADTATATRAEHRRSYRPPPPWPLE